MEKMVERVLGSLSEKEELAVYSLGIDLGYPLDKKTGERIKEKTLERLGIVRPQRRLAWTKIAIVACIAFVLAAVSVYAVSEPLRDRVVKIFNGQPEVTEDRVYPYLESPEYTPIGRPISQTVDFSEKDLSAADRIVVTSGRTGEVKEFDEIGGLIEKIKGLKGHSPVSSRGRSGFCYFVKIYSGSDTLLEFGLYDADGEKLLIYGVFEEFRGIEYKGVYTSDEAVDELTFMLDESFGAEGE